MTARRETHRFDQQPFPTDDCSAPSGGSRFDSEISMDSSFTVDLLTSRAAVMLCCALLALLSPVGERLPELQQIHHVERRLCACAEHPSACQSCSSRSRHRRPECFTAYFARPHRGDLCHRWRSHCHLHRLHRNHRRHRLTDLLG